MGAYTKIIRIFFIAFMFCTLSSCVKEKTLGLKNIYKTEYKIHYASGSIRYHVAYTCSEPVACSFNGTNYLLEKDKDEEIVSTTAQIEILSITKYDKAGNAQIIIKNEKL